jgi:hypothetical protein
MTTATYAVCAPIERRPGPGRPVSTCSPRCAALRRARVATEVARRRLAALEAGICPTCRQQITDAKPAGDDAGERLLAWLWPLWALRRMRGRRALEQTQQPRRAVHVPRSRWLTRSYKLEPFDDWRTPDGHWRWRR